MLAAARPLWSPSRLLARVLVAALAGLFVAGAEALFFATRPVACPSRPLVLAAPEVLVGGLHF